ncbi:MAG: hypothetical protein HKN49_01725, partial [Gammaproteobacteria bacterium]|nr:hypothetical protein [Gammaproteobacteria bacterium]
LSVYFSFAPDETEHLHFKGGALGDATFSLSVVGEGWQEPPADLRAAIPLHIAHEAAHLWNLHLGSGERAGAWMHEGNANVLAWLALRETGYLSEDEFSTLVCAAESACLNQLGSSTLASQETAGASSVSYDCGAVVAHATDRAMRASGNGDLFDFTNALIARLDSRPGTNRHYFDQLYAMTGTNLVAQHDNNFAVRADDLAALQTCSD